jgi:hypothetical protein
MKNVVFWIVNATWLTLRTDSSEERIVFIFRMKRITELKARLAVSKKVKLSP